MPDHPPPLPCLLACLALAALALPVAAETPPAPADLRLDVDVSGVHNARGRIGCLLFKSDKGFPDEAARAARRTWVPAESGKTAVCTFQGLPAGDYAVAVMHDENSNGELDTNFFGAPTEGFGFSNGAQPGMVSPPAYSKARIRLTAAARWPVRLTYP